MEKWLSTIDAEQSFKVPAWTEYEKSLFPTRLHAQHAALEEMGRAWAERRLAPLLSLREMQRVRDGQYGRLACHYWPFCPDEARSMVLIKFAYWVFLFDDLMDDPLLLRGNVEQVRLFCGHLLHVMFGTALEEGLHGVVKSENKPHHVSWSKQEKLVLELGNECWNDMKITGMSLAMQSRFASEVTRYVSAQLNFNLFREMPPHDVGIFHLDDFTHIRKIVTGIPIALVLVEYDLGIELDEVTLGSSLIQELNSAINNHISWINDIISFATDYKNQDALNLVTMLHINNNNNSSFNITQVPFNVALSQAWEHVKDTEKQCTLLVRKVRESPHLASKLGLQDYIESIFGIAGANWTWSLKSARYVGPSKILNWAISAHLPTTMCYNSIKGNSSVMYYNPRLPRTKLNTLQTYPKARMLQHSLLVERKFQAPCNYDIGLIKVFSV